MALIAYQNPATSPVGVFLSQDQRFSVAEALNAAILGIKIGIEASYLVFDCV